MQCWWVFAVWEAVWLPNIRYTKGSFLHRRLPNPVVLFLLFLRLYVSSDIFSKDSSDRHFFSRISDTASLMAEKTT